MFRDKNFLIEKGMYQNCRADVFQLVGTYYDDFMERKVFDKEQVEKSRRYLDKHRELIDNLDRSISIAQTSSVLTRLKDIYKKLYPEESKIKLNKKDKMKGYGIYGIYMNDKLVYIGETIRTFEERFREHKKGFEDNKEQKYIELNKAKKNGAKITLVPLIDMDELLGGCKNKRSFTEKEIKCMELVLIKMYQPIFNIEGRIKEYQF